MFRAICCISIHKKVAPLALNKVNLDRFVDVINQLQTDVSEQYRLLKRQNQFALRRLEKKQAKQIISTEEMYLYREFYHRQTKMAEGVIKRLMTHTIKLAAYNKRLQLHQPKDHPVTQAYFQDIVYKTVEQEKLVKELKKAILDIYIFLHPNATN